MHWRMFQCFVRLAMIPFHFVSLWYAADQDNQGDALPFLSFWMPVGNERKKGNSNCNDCKMRKSNSIHTIHPMQHWKECSVQMVYLFIKWNEEVLYISQIGYILTYQKVPKYLRFISKRTIPSCLLLFSFVLLLSSIWLTHVCAAVQMKCTATNQNRCKHVLSTTFQHIFRREYVCAVHARLLRFGYNLPYYLRVFPFKVGVKVSVLL